MQLAVQELRPVNAWPIGQRLLNLRTHSGRRPDRALNLSFLGKNEWILSGQKAWQKHWQLAHVFPNPLRPLFTTTSCKNVETLRRKNDLSCFKSLLVTGLRGIILTSLLPSIQSCSSKFWVWSCIASNFDKGWRGGHKHKTTDRPFKAKYGTVSQVLLHPVVAGYFSTNFGRTWERLAKGDNTWR